MPLFLTILLALLLVYISILFVYLHHHEHELKKKEETMYEDAEQILQNTHKRSVKIISRAVVKSKEILDQTKLFKSNIENQAEGAVVDSLQKYTEELEKSAQEIAVAYEDLFDQVKQQYLDHQNQRISQMEEVAKSEIENFSKSLTDKTAVYQQTLTQVVEGERHSVEEIEKVASEEIKKLSDTITKKSLEYEINLESKVTEGLSAATTEIEKIKQAIDEIHVAAKKGIEEFDASLDKKTAEYEQVLAIKMNEELQHAQDESEKYKATISKLEEVGNQGVENLNKIITETALNCQKDMEQKVVDEFEKAKVEIAQFKEQEILKIKENTESVIKKLSIELLGKTIKAEDHEQMLLAALEEAKKENIFI